MSTIKLTQEQVDKKAQLAYRASGYCDWGNWNHRKDWQKVVIAVLESDGDKVEIIEPEPEIPSDAIHAALGAYYNEEKSADHGPLRISQMRRALGAVVKSGLLPGREPK